ncbi:MAG: helix-hairpin-helix domain-containing protein [Cyclobacteriaceae bacterium]|nr:helix-hairpin-helix domain-containing protein [Cyclobacteriaceae bacterium]
MKSKDIDALVLSWLNILSSDQMDEFFWDYPSIHDYSSVGYGLGKTTATKIVIMREKRASGFTSVNQIRKIKGVGADKISDMRMQAKEALVMAEYYKITTKPLQLYKKLAAIGFGQPLTLLIKGMVENLNRTLITTRGLVSKKVSSLGLEIPFVSLIPIHERGVNDKPVFIDRFQRIRVQPWAFVVHDSNLFWKLNIDIKNESAYTVHLKKAI